MKGRDWRGFCRWRWRGIRSGRNSTARVFRSGCGRWVGRRVWRMGAMRRVSEFVRSRLALRVAAFVAVCLFMVCFLKGWRKEEADFPNYYTAARLVADGNHDLRSYYDWTWFARQMDYAGMERQVGAYSPQTPLTALPMVGFARMPVQWAKRAWLICNLVFLALTVWMLSRVGELRWEAAWLAV